MGRGDARSVLGIMTMPLLGGACATLLLLGLNRAGGHGTVGSGPSGFAEIGTQLTLLAYYVPGLGQVAFLARQRATLTPPSWACTAMRAVCASACVELVLAVARSAVIVARASGVRDDGRAILVIGFLQGVAVIWGIGALAVGPAMILISARCWPWLAYWRLRPLWAVVREAVPDVEQPAPRGLRAGIRQRLLRRVTEIREAEHALSPYWRNEIAARALAATGSAALDADLEQAVVEAAIIVDAAAARLSGMPPSPEAVPVDLIRASAGDDLRSEADRLVLVSRAIRHCPIIRELQLPVTCDERPDLIRAGCGRLVSATESKPASPIQGRGRKTSQRVQSGR